MKAAHRTAAIMIGVCVVAAVVAGNVESVATPAALVAALALVAAAIVVIRDGSKG